MEVKSDSLEQALKDHLTHENHRLDRIEAKLDKLTDTVVALARAEEKLISLENSRQEISQILEEHEDRVTSVEKRTESIEVTTNILSRLFWIGIASGATYFVAHFIENAL